MAIKLTGEDKTALKNLDEKLAEIKDLTTLCASGDLNGAYIWGEGGIGKSYSAIEQLKKMKIEFRLHNTRLSGRAFYNLLDAYPKSVYVIEDVENIFTDRQSMNLLRSALWGQPDITGKQHRPVAWGIHSNDGVGLSVDFEGSIIFTGNRALGKIPELRALATRLDVMELVVTFDEIVARMKEISLKGYKTDKGELTASQCGEVLELVLHEIDEFLDESPQPLIPDIRVFILCLKKRIGKDRLGDEIQSTWQEMVRRAMRHWLKSRSVEPETPTRQRLDPAVYMPKAVVLSKMKLNKRQMEVKWKEIAGKKTLDSYYYLLRKAK